MFHVCSRMPSSESVTRLCLHAAVVSIMNVFEAFHAAMNSQCTRLINLASISFIKKN